MGAATPLLILPLLPPLPGASMPGPRADSMGTTLVSSVLSSNRNVSGITSPVQVLGQRAQELLWGGKRQKKEKQKVKLGQGISQAHGFQFLTIPDWGVLSPRQVLALVPAGTETAAWAPQSPEQPQPFLLSQGLGCSRSLFRVTNASAARSAWRQLPRAGAAASQLSPRPVLAHEICRKHSSRTALLLPPLRGLSLQRSGGP